MTRRITPFPSHSFLWQKSLWNTVKSMHGKHAVHTMQVHTFIKTTWGFHHLQTSVSQTCVTLQDDECWFYSTSIQIYISCMISFLEDTKQDFSLVFGQVCILLKNKSCSMERNSRTDQLGGKPRFRVKVEAIGQGGLARFPNPLAFGSQAGTLSRFAS